MLNNLIEKYPILEDQINLFENSLFKDEILEKKYKKYIAFSSAFALKNKKLYDLVEEKLGTLEEKEKEAILYASSRMAVTNPYFMARNIQPLKAQGDLNAINMRDFSLLKVEDEISYHYACIAISTINGGYICFNSHLNSLKVKKQSDDAINQALKIIAAMHSLNQLYFNSELI